MEMLERIRKEVEAEDQAAAQAPDHAANPAASQAQSAELLGQTSPAAASAAQAQSAEMQGAALSPQLVEVLASPEANDVLGPEPAQNAAMTGPDPAVVKLMNELIASLASQDEDLEPAAPGTPLETIPERPELEALAELEAQHEGNQKPSGPQRPARFKPTLATIPEEKSRPPLNRQGGQEQLVVSAPRQDASSQLVKPKPNKGPSTASKIADTGDWAVGPGVAAGAPAALDTPAAVLTVADAKGDPLLGDQSEAIGGHIGTASSALGIVGAGFRLKTGYDKRAGGKAKLANPDKDASQTRAGKAAVKGGRTDMAQGTNALTGATLGTSKAIATAAGAAEAATGVMGTVGGGIGAVGGLAAMARHGRKGKRALYRYKALKALKGNIADRDLEAVRSYASGKNKKAAILQGNLAAGGALGAGAGVATIVGGVAAGAALATPVGWALGGTALAVGLGVTGYTAGRKIYKHHKDKHTPDGQPKRGDKRQRMAEKLREKLDDPLAGIRSEAKAIVEALGLTEEEAKGEDGVDLLAKKMRTM